MVETRDSELAKTLKQEPLTMSICVTNAAAARAFYKDALGAREVHVVEEDDGSGRVAHAQLVADQLAGGFQFFLGSDYEEPNMNTSAAKPGAGLGPVHAFINVENPDKCVDRMVAAGAKLTFATADTYCMRVGKVVDKFGVGWTFGSCVKGKPDE